jgi:nucleotide-binding universal stress UspA family protein
MAASRIMVGYDGSAHARDALRLARVISRVTGASITLAGVVRWDPPTLSPVPAPELAGAYERQEEEAQAELERVAREVGAEAQAGPGPTAARGLYALADDLEPELVIVGSSHRGRVGQVLAGNVALGLLTGLSRPLAVAPAGYAVGSRRLETIGVGFDGSPESKAALRTAGDLARDANARVRLIGVAAEAGEIAPYPWAFNWVGMVGKELVEEVRRKLEDAAAGLPPGVESSVEVYTGTAAGSLLDQTEQLDLLVVGSRGYGPVRRVLLGSVSSQLVRSAACPVLVVPRPASDEDAQEQSSAPVEAEA